MWRGGERAAMVGVERDTVGERCWNKFAEVVSMLCIICNDNYKTGGCVDNFDCQINDEIIAFSPF